MKQNSKLPGALRLLIADTSAVLNEVIKEQTDATFFRLLETLKADMAREQSLPSARWQTLLQQTCDNLGALDKNTQHQLIHSFTLMIESVNACETAYRTFRISQSQSDPLPPSENIIVFVLTAHPTEARAPANIALFQQVHDCCVQMLRTKDSPAVYQKLKHLFKLAWLTPVARHKRPQVLDEAESLFSNILRPEILDSLIHLRQSGIEIRVRTWVGGDKDGHLGVDETVMLKVMACARKRLIAIINDKLDSVFNDIHLTGLRFESMETLLRECRRQLKRLTKITPHDGHNLFEFKAIFNDFTQTCLREIGALHPELTHIDTLIAIFPALIIPLELREDAREVHKALQAEKPFAITRMLQAVAKICMSSNVDDYIKGFILSMTHTSDDIKAGLQLVEQQFGHNQIRVVPLFETEHALRHAAEIVQNLFENNALHAHIKTVWNNRFEIMLGYSDSAKGMGVLPSRLAIANTMHALDELCQQYAIVPVFFHGSGGSVDRGGGSIQEQTAWWPQSSFHLYKTTIQGEMVERSFASEAITTNMVRKLLSEAGKKHDFTPQTHSTLEAFASRVSHYYQQQIESPDFLEVVAQATSYRLLDKLKFGSRPVKRKNRLTVESLRAIPWVLCWTQTRILFPTWWGIGSAWHECDDSERNDLQLAFENNPLFRSFIKLLGFTLTKVDLTIWTMYVQNSSLSPTVQQQVLTAFSNELSKACEATRHISKQNNLLWFRPWLAESIQQRACMVNPLNLLQIHAIKANDAFLIRETTTGIAAGMLTTG